MCHQLLLLPASPRHVDHSAALPKVAQMISEAKAAAAAGGHTPQDQSGEGDAGQTAAAAGGGDPAVFDLHPRHPFRRGLLLRGEVIPLNKVVHCCCCCFCQCSFWPLYRSLPCLNPCRLTRRQPSAPAGLSAAGHIAFPPLKKHP